mgnify:CR=1 FL=1
MSRFNSFWNRCIRILVRDGLSRKEKTMALKFTNNQIYHLSGQQPISEYINDQRNKFIQHIIRAEDSNMLKMLLFHAEKKRLKGRFETQLETMMKYV